MSEKEPVNPYGEVRLKEKITLKGVYTIEGGVLEALQLWRPRVGEAFTVSDIERHLFRARLTGLGEGKAFLLAFEDIGCGRTELETTLLQALTEKERMELIIQKTTELGISSIVPFKSERSVSLEEREALQKKAHRWQDVALKAARQSRRGSIPVVRPYSTFSEAISSVRGSEVRVVLHEKQGIAHIKTILSGKRGAVKRVAVLSGPEGGFTDDEIIEAGRAGFVPASLGRRILRAETAPILAAGLIGYELGD